MTLNATRFTVQPVPAVGVGTNSPMQAPETKESATKIPEMKQLTDLIQVHDH